MYPSSRVVTFNLWTCILTIFPQLLIQLLYRHDSDVRTSFLVIGCTARRWGWH